MKSATIVSVDVEGGARDSFWRIVAVRRGKSAESRAAGVRHPRDR